MNRDELRKEAARLDIKGRSKMTVDELVAAIQDTPGNNIRINRSGDVTWADPYASVPDLSKPVVTPTVEEANDMMQSFKQAYPRAARHARKVTRDANALTSMRYGMRGRGMGAKHYPSRPVNRVSNPDRDKPLSYGDRVRHYAKQNGQATLTADNFPGAMLTPKQWRRAVKKQNKNRAFGTKESRYV